jgi:hypothetical protein
LKDDQKMRVNLDSQDDGLYIGTLFLGAPKGQQVRVIFDTGSEHLAVTGNLCDDKAAGNYHFGQEGGDKISLTQEDKPVASEGGKGSRCNTKAYNLVDSTS